MISDESCPEAPLFFSTHRSSIMILRRKFFVRRIIIIRNWSQKLVVTEGDACLTKYSVCLRGQ